jgi:hypothetical protein
VARLAQRLTEGKTPQGLDDRLEHRSAGVRRPPAPALPRHRHPRTRGRERLQRQRLRRGRRAAAPTPDWNGESWGEPNDDEYLAPIAVAQPGSYDFAYRFTGDGGRSWTYCDRDGSDDGYQLASAGHLLVE